MKYLILIMAIFVMVGSVLTLKDPICGLPHSKDGDGLRQCRALIPSWSYDQDSKECLSFAYGGCGGNDNRFNSKEECESKCKE
ncbi:male accessory gland serine protease inhibitor-like [Haematobia irritans]|uniref:male accessory gland serine protease inhibitor-like n=1 Tax=Haematobia irritans TaxID=7368 RepID=UPI003F4FA0C1